MTTDPRFDGGHLDPLRRALYEHARDDVFAACGPHTREFERLAAAEFVRADGSVHIPTGVPYALLDARSGLYHPLRVGLTAIGRLPENDIVLSDNPISRRHCAVLVHATGGCEIRDTASRNGTWVNGRRVGRVWLVPGDVLRLCDWKFVLAARVGREELVFGVLPAGESTDPPATTEFRTAPGASWCGA